MTEQESLAEELLVSDPLFRRLHDEHQDCERQLEQIHQRSFPSQEDEANEKRLKRHKLTLKDHMFAILREHREHHVSV